MLITFQCYACGSLKAYGEKCPDKNCKANQKIKTIPFLYDGIYSPNGEEVIIRHFIAGSDGKEIEVTIENGIIKERGN